jgi:hypothetical protein
MKAYPTLQLLAKSEESAKASATCEGGLTNAKIHEVISSKAGLINNLLQHGLINTVWNVAQHDLKMMS